MSKQSKRRVGEDAASEQPRGEPDTHQVQGQSATNCPTDSLIEFPRQVLSRSESWHRQRVMQATSIAALEYHVRLMIARRALVMRDVHDAWPDCYPAVIQGAVEASGLPVRFRSVQLRAHCRAAIAAARKAI